MPDDDWPMMSSSFICFISIFYDLCFISWNLNGFKFKFLLYIFFIRVTKTSFWTSIKKNETLFAVDKFHCCCYGLHNDDHMRSLHSAAVPSFKFKKFLGNTLTFCCCCFYIYFNIKFLVEWFLIFVHH